MSTVEIKRKWIGKIDKIDDEYLLNEVNRLVDLETADLEIYQLNTEQKAAIEET
jgi:hypothetical protein